MRGCQGDSLVQTYL